MLHLYAWINASCHLPGVFLDTLRTLITWCASMGFIPSTNVSITGSYDGWLWGQAYLAALSQSA